jgi:pimeloyl-ACP methyl ester carboxylesterase
VFIEPVLAANDSFSIVGHSNGAAVGLMVALAYPQRVRALALYEPTLFCLLDAESPQPNAADGIRQAAHASGRALDQGRADEAAKHFIDYWMGPTGWKNTPESRRAPITASILNVRRWRSCTVDRAYCTRCIQASGYTRALHGGQGIHSAGFGRRTNSDARIAKR